MIGTRSRFNIAPVNEMPVIVHTQQDELAVMRWGLVPHWTQDLHAASPLINARAETLTEKPSFKPLLKNHRCLVPVSGFFEWKKEGTRKIPFYVHLPEDPCFAFAGLYDEWHDPAGTTLSTYTIITTEANALMAPIHNRQPAILSLEQEKVWLAGDVPGPDLLKEILAPCPAERMAMYPVSARVNSPVADDEQVIQPLNAPGSTLFG
jgi:putative SOS response-associated peptidase YedK